MYVCISISTIRPNDLDNFLENEYEQMETSNSSTIELIHIESARKHNILQSVSLITPMLKYIHLIVFA